MTETKERLEYILKATNETYNSLGNKIGLKTNQILYDIKSGKIKNFSYDVARAIQKKYPRFRLEWIMEGTGDKYEIKDGFILGEGAKVAEERRVPYSMEKESLERDAEVLLLKQLLVEKDERIKAASQQVKDKETIIHKTESIVKDKEEIIDLLKQKLAERRTAKTFREDVDPGAV